jgi:hypothetical protein
MIRSSIKQQTRCGARTKESKIKHWRLSGLKPLSAYPGFVANVEALSTGHG